MNRDIVSREFIGRKKFSDFHFYKLYKLGIVYHICFVHEYDDVGHAYLPCQHDMCSRVCGIGPSAADTTSIAPSICAAPVIMFFT